MIFVTLLTHLHMPYLGNKRYILEVQQLCMYDRYISPIAWMNTSKIMDMLILLQEIDILKTVTLLTQHGSGNKFHKIKNFIKNEFNFDNGHNTNNKLKLAKVFICFRKFGYLKHDKIRSFWGSFSAISFQPCKIEA